MIQGRKFPPAYHLKPGELVITDRPMLISTILGSCVSVTMFSPRFGGAICHGMLPTCGRKDFCRYPCGEEFRYVDCAIRAMIGSFSRRKVAPKEIEVKLFGGSDMLSQSEERASASVGRKNISTALEMLTEKGFTIAVSDVGGKRGRKIFFDTGTGEVHLKRLNTIADSAFAS